MGSKNQPGNFDCYENALPDEPLFVLLGRDPEFERIVLDWAARRHQAILNGDRPDSDMKMVEDAMETAMAGSRWRKVNMGKWRKPQGANDER